MKIRNIIIGSIVAGIVAGIIIFSIENNKSFYQIISGFLLFILPFTFLSAFTSKTGSFIFVFVSIIITYLVSKFMFGDFWLGVILAAVIGVSVFYFRVFKYKPFNSNLYKQQFKNKNKLN